MTPILIGGPDGPDPPEPDVLDGADAPEAVRDELLVWWLLDPHALKPTTMAVANANAVRPDLKVARALCLSMFPPEE